jgi:isopenicillin N synthase-like dioxygenase
MSMFRYPRQTEEEALKGIGHNKHTDIGTFTFLLCQQWGLQVLSPQQNQWLYVAPKKNHAIINVGDSLRFLTGNQLLSAVHRVLPFTNRQLEHRHSIAFFLRPADDTVYRDSNGRLVTANEWHNDKFNHFRASHAEQSSESILTGGMEKGDRIAVAL